MSEFIYSHESNITKTENNTEIYKYVVINCKYTNTIINNSNFLENMLKKNKLLFGTVIGVSSESTNNKTKFYLRKDTIKCDESKVLLGDINPSYTPISNNYEKIKEIENKISYDLSGCIFFELYCLNSLEKILNYIIQYWCNDYDDSVHLICSQIQKIFTIDNIIYISLDCVKP